MANIINIHIFMKFCAKYGVAVVVVLAVVVVVVVAAGDST